MCIYIYIERERVIHTHIHTRVCASGEATAIWSFRHCKPAARILGLTGANVRLSLMCGFP